MTDPVSTVHGDPDGGFIVEVHDGIRHFVHTLFGGDEDAAHAEGLRRFQETAPVVDDAAYVTRAEVETMIEAAMEAKTAPADPLFLTHDPDGRGSEEGS